MLLAELVETSRRITETTRRLEKIDLLSTLLRRLRPDEIEIVVAYLSGRMRQGRIGAGYRTIHDASATPAGQASLDVLDLDRTFHAVAETSGPGSEARRIALLHECLARATAPRSPERRGRLTRACHPRAALTPR